MVARARSTAQNLCYISLVCALFIELCGGAVYVFGTYSNQLKEALFSQDPNAQSKVQSLALASNIGNYVPITGFVYDSRVGGPQRAVLYGAFFNFVGYFFLFLAARGSLNIPFGALLLLMAFTGHGSSYFDSSSVTVTMKNFAANRGFAIGFLKSFYGLSGSVLAIFYFALFQRAEGCAGSEHGCCADGKTQIDAVPPLCPPKFAGNCTIYQYGCCSDGTTQRDDSAGGNCMHVTQGELGAAHFLLFLGVALSCVAVIASARLRERTPVPPGPPAVRAGRCFERGFALVLLMGLFLLSMNIIKIETGNFSESVWYILLAITVVLLALFASLAKEPQHEASDDNADSAEDTLLDAGKDQGLAPDESDIAIAPAQVFCCAHYWLLFFTLFAGQGGGLMVLNNVSQMYKAQNLSTSSASMAVSLLSIFNCFGRMLAGLGSDKVKARVTRPWILAGAVIFMGVAHAIFLIPGEGMLFFGCVITGLAYGAQWSLSPAIVGDIFGLKYFASNYSLLALAPTIGSIVLSTAIASSIYQHHAHGKSDCFGSACYAYTHAIIVACCIVGAVCAVVLARSTRQVYSRML